MLGETWRPGLLNRHLSCLTRLKLNISHLAFGLSGPRQASLNSTPLCRCPPEGHAEASVSQHLPKHPLPGQWAPTRELKRVGGPSCGRSRNLWTHGAPIGFQEGAQPTGLTRKHKVRAAVQGRPPGRCARGPGSVLNLNPGPGVRRGRILKPWDTGRKQRPALCGRQA